MSDYNRPRGGNPGVDTGSGSPAGYSVKKNQAAATLPRSTGNMIVGDGIVNPFLSKIADIFETLAQLKINGFVEKTHGQKGDSRIFLQVLNGLGFEVVMDSELSPGIDNLKNFSFIGAENIDKTIENPNITDPDLNKLTPVQIPASDKFKSAADAFYELDESPPDSLKKITENQKLESFTKLRVFAELIARSAKKSKNKMITKNNRNSER